MSNTLVSDSMVMARRNFEHVRRVPEKLLDVTLQPIMFTLLFAFVFGAVIAIPGGSYREYLMPGIYIQTLAFASVTTARTRSPGIASATKTTRPSACLATPTPPCAMPVTSSSKTESHPSTRPASGPALTATASAFATASSSTSALA